MCFIFTWFLPKKETGYTIIVKKGVEVKIHYPKPMYLQEALKYLNYKKGDFPITENHTKKLLLFLVINI